MALSTFFTEPFYSLSDFDRLFDEAFNARTRQGSSAVASREQGNTAVRPMRPRMDLHEDKEKNLVTATFELPGLTKENVQLDVKDNVLTVAGESTLSTERDEKGYSLRERRFGQFSRSIPLPQGISPEEIKATMVDGVLTVTFPRSTPELAPKKIAIQ
ncbi:HSP20-like chaperone [Trametes versicolor FP-101664 SS1]|uniref:HSP20-like chaperone n=1 Tax=Trametes versicolor (strain FP-101664) TaxID=717944 RepID=UPI00046219A0|nr:HSP20-like chaperone [Trametes versicolor FP-101664 SS1]EIW56634.1 HSP20-like chaperone [Trametes versicolor FP-101664 SS1]